MKDAHLIKEGPHTFSYCVIPAKAGIQGRVAQSCQHWIAAFAGTAGRQRLLKGLGAAWLLMACGVVQAETYRVDLIVFADQYRSSAEGGDPNASVKTSGAIEPDNASALGAAGIQILPDAQFGLEDEWRHLRNSKQFRPLVRLAWTQKDPPGERGPSLRIRSNGSGKAVADPRKPADAVPTTTNTDIDGSVALLLGRYLHVDADVRYTSEGQSWTLTERRRMRRDEVHHLDSPRLGILAKVTKADGTP